MYEEELAQMRAARIERDRLAQEHRQREVAAASASVHKHYQTSLWVGSHSLYGDIEWSPADVEAETRAGYWRSKNGR